jgi:orotidine-5'-phosphate decarboxylase
MLAAAAAAMVAVVAFVGLEMHVRAVLAAAAAAERPRLVLAASQLAVMSCV